MTVSREKRNITHYCLCCFFWFWFVILFSYVTADLETYCTTNDSCSIDCTNVLECTDRRIYINQGINYFELLVGTVSGYGTEIYVGYEILYPNTTNSINSSESIDILVNVSSTYSVGYSMMSSQVKYYNENTTFPINLLMNCETQQSCNGSSFDLDSYSNVTLLCNGDYTCRFLEFNGQSDTFSYGFIDNLTMICNGNNSCSGSIFNSSNMIVDKVTVECNGAGSCDGLSLAAIEMNIICNENVTCNNMIMEGLASDMVDDFSADYGYDSDTISAGLNFECAGIGSCSGIEVYNVDLLSFVTMNCNGENTCNDVLIQSVSISETTNTVIDYQFNNHSVEINCNGDSTCHRLSVYCPFWSPNKGI